MTTSHLSPSAADLVSEAEDVSSHLFLDEERILPSVDFPLQFNFGSIYSSSLTIYFDNN